MKAAIAAVLGASLLVACTANQKPQTSSAPKARAVPYAKNPFPSTYKAYPGVPTLVTKALLTAMVVPTVALALWLTRPADERRSGGGASYDQI